jgi:acetate kinase
MNGVDAIVFTAGMGENNSEMRERVCTDMEFFGIKIDLDANAKTYKPQGPMEISTPDSKVKVFVIPTNEELMIARETDRIVSARK